MKRFMLTVVLTCLLSVSVLAGESPTCLVSLPPTPVAGTTTASGHIATDTSTASEETSDLLTTIILAIITWP